MNEQLEIEGDKWADVENEAHYLDWCERNNVTPDLIPAGMGTDPSGEPVQVWRFA